MFHMSQASRDLSFTQSVRASALFRATVAILATELNYGCDVAAATDHVFPETFLTGAIDHEDAMPRFHQVLQSRNVGWVSGTNQDCGLSEIKRDDARGVNTTLQRDLKIAHHLFRARVDQVSILLRIMEPLRERSAGYNNLDVVLLAEDISCFLHRGQRTAGSINVKDGGTLFRIRLYGRDRSPNS